jgi:RimJ/RimL family protein N-acetyltransferase
VCRFSAVPWVFTPVAALEWIGLQRQRRSAGTGLTLAVTQPGEQLPVGNVNLCRFGEDGRAALGYWVVPAARGRGVATTAAQLLCAWGFEQLHLTSIELAVRPQNVASQRVAQRLGARADGLRPNSHRADGRSWDMLIYTLVAPAP